MLIRKYRLTKRNDFQSIFKTGYKNFNKFFSLRYKLNNLENSRIAVVVSNKVAKKATDRNRIKRQVRSIISDFLPNFKQNFDVIINILSPSLNQEYNIIQEELSKILKKSNIL
ncbi:ribonuclease P protein component [Candidatus Falkowbacteria bacterium]|uniref:Ribonuclease P protein component n=1 Tax=Candidatus Buchananbacteria bacterium CG10_big_fil_rev_8_21_14_0_10_33_19 TaxID=1974525 RepID=A0A2H0W7E5_9BACT|nr:ribonuclease P protein component [Candidatus Falkowbacteria bacterium]PIS06540.1 MAG: ribonuclease P protein component [Candidatus Buchananbacteria bacterium CG10_big_fil_rev_8_21_14_0_10_33_19]